MDDLITSAYRHYQGIRCCPANWEPWGNNRFLSPDRNSNRLEQDFLSTMVNPEDPTPRHELLRLFDTNRRGSIIKPVNFSSKNYAFECPILVHVGIERHYNTDSWQFPTSQHLSELIDRSVVIPSDSNQIEMKEIVIGKSSDVEVRQFIKFVHEQKYLERSTFPVDILACDVLTANLPVESILEYEKKTDPVTIKHSTVTSCGQLNLTKKGSRADMPIKLVFGGLNWLASIMIDISRIDEDHFVLRHSKMQHDLKAFLLSEMTLATKDVELLKLFMNNLNSHHNINITFGESLKLVSIPALALASGYRNNDLSFSAISIFTTAQPALNFARILPDNDWILPIGKMKKEYQLYIINILRALYTCSVTYMTILLRNLFPDPEIMCDLLELNQEESLAFLCGAVLHCLDGVNPPDQMPREVNSLAEEVITRKDLLKACSSKKEVKILCQMLPNWPNITYGGARDLHRVRSFACEQYVLLSSLRFTHNRLAPNLYKIMSASSDIVNLLSYDRCFDDLHPECVRQEAGLASNKNFERKVLTLDPSSITDEDLIEFGTIGIGITGNSRKCSILEWGRLNVGCIGPLMHRLNKLASKGMTDNFWFTRTTIYEGLRLIHKRCMNLDTLKVPDIEYTIQKRSERTYLSLKQAAESPYPDKDAVRRADIFASIKSGNRDIPKVALHQKVLDKVPGNNTKRNQMMSKKRKLKRLRAKALSDASPPRIYKIRDDQTATKSRCKDVGKANTHSRRTMSTHGVQDLREVLASQTTKVPNRARGTGRLNVKSKSAEGVRDLRDTLSNQNTKVPNRASDTGRLSVKAGLTKKGFRTITYP